MNNYTVQRIAGKVGRDFLIEHHYTHSCHGGPMTWGLFDGESLLGVVAFATPAGETVRACVFGEDYKKAVTELHRLFITDGTPKNTETWFIARALKQLKEERPYIDAVISYADSTQSHTGVIYRASNFFFTGYANKRVSYRTQDGALRHHRSNGVEISREDAAQRGWTAERRERKLRYVLLLPNDRRHKKLLQERFKLPILPYPNDRG